MRIKWIDNAKGIAIILVIIGHVGLDLTGLWDFSFVYGIHLVMFFLISGYTLKKTEITNEYINKKFSRLMIPYFYTCLAVMMMDIINCFMKHEGSVENVTKVIKNDILRSFFASGRNTNFGNIEYGMMIGAVWFFPALFFALIIFQMVINKLDNDIETGVCFACISILSVISARFIWLPFSFQSGCMATFFIYIGYIVNKNKILKKIKWYHFVLAQVIFLWGVLKDYSGISFARATANDLIISLVVGLAGCIMLYLVSIIYKGRVFAYLGKNSLLILCVHLFSIDTLEPYYNYVINKLSLTGNKRIWTYILLQILFAVFGALLISKLEILFKSKSDDKAIIQVSSYDNKKELHVMMGIFALFYMIASYNIDIALCRMLSSCVLFAFVFTEGFLSCGDSIKNNIKNVLKLLVFYTITLFLCVVYKVYQGAGLYDAIKKCILSLSNDNSLVNGNNQISVLNVILVLAIVKLVSSFLNYMIKNDVYMIIISLALSAFGLNLVSKGIVLPFGLDISCFLLLFYQFGKMAKKYDLLKLIKSSHMIYFIASICYSYMIYLGGIDCLNRNYCEYGIGIIGVCSGIVIIYKLVVYLTEKYRCLSSLFAILGHNACVTFAVCHIVKYNAWIDFDNQNIKYLAITLLLQVFAVLSANFIIYYLHNKKFNQLNGD